MQHVVDLDAGDGRALQRRHQNATQRVAERQAKATLQRFGDNGRHALSISTGLHDQLLRLNEFLPILVDHAFASILVACPCPVSR